MNSAISSEPNGTNTVRRMLSLAGVFFFFVVLWLLDFPKPFVDDLFYTGAGVNLADGGDLSNPWLARQHFPSHYFFEYPPIHSFFLAGFLKVFGVSALSQTGFQILMYFVTSVATMAVLRKYGAPTWLQRLAPLGVCSSFLYVGLRPEPLSAALTMAGFALIECGGRRWATTFAAFLLMFLGGACAPRLALFSGALVAAAAWRLREDSRAGGWRQWTFCLPAICALMTTAAIFLWMIGFRVAEFLSTFRFHAGHRVEGSTVFGFLVEYFKHFTGFTLLPILLLTLTCVLLQFRRVWSRDMVSGLLLLLSFVLTVMEKGVGHGVAWYLVLMVFVLLTALSKSNLETWKGMAVLLVLTLLVANSRIILNVVGILCGEIQDDVGPEAKMAAQIQSSTEHQALVDCDVARYVFDYKIPPGYIDFYFSAPFPGFGVPDYYHPPDVYLVGPEYVVYLEKFTHLGSAAPPRWRPLKSDYWGFFEKPHEVFVIPAETCKGLK